MTELQYTGIFWWIEHHLYLFTAPLEKSEPYGDFLNYPYGHMEAWDLMLAARFGDDYGAYPRGRIVYREADNTFLIYRDPLIPDKGLAQILDVSVQSCQLLADEHYQISHPSCIWGGKGVQ